ncbi:hypothetical protein niasHT_000813 [Heterodera trifolii]|uniref:GDP-L-fucose synthase n=1 Tax=Heterodera trifolii TaxID=157864 RepID=A0ABD2MDA7_9BILA
MAQKGDNESGGEAAAAVRVLVTGGTGLVGSAIRQVVTEEEQQQKPQRLKEQWFFVGSSECDLTDLEQTRALFRRVRPTHVVNLAAMVGGLFHNLRHNLQFFVKNLAICQNVLQCCHETDVERCVSCLSTCIFPDKTPYPIDETMVYNGPPHDSNFGYSYAKRMIDVLNRGYAQEHNRKYTSAVPCNIFGPRDNYNLEDAHVVPALIHKCFLAKRDGGPLVVAGSGKPLRQFIYSLDLGRLFVWAIREYEDVTPIIFCVDPSDEVTIADLVNAIVKAMQFKGEVIFDTMKADGQYKKTSSNAKLRARLPDFEFTPFERAIAESVQWFEANYEKARK